MYIVGSRNNLFHGTMNAAGTLTNEIDLADYAAFGLMSDSNLVLGTLSFQGSPYSDNETDADKTPFYRDILDESGDAVTIGPVSGAIAIKSDVIVQALGGYRYVKIKMSPAQTNGVAFFIPA